MSRDDDESTSDAASWQQLMVMCKICQLPLNEPKRLPCLHTFCKACLLYHVKVNGISTHDDHNDHVVCLFCPLCRQV